MSDVRKQNYSAAFGFSGADDSAQSPNITYVSEVGDQDVSALSNYQTPGGTARAPFCPKPKRDLRQAL